MNVRGLLGVPNPLHAGMSIVSSHVVRALSLMHSAFSESEAQDRLRTRPDRGHRMLRCPRRATHNSIAGLWNRLRCTTAVASADEQLLADPDTLANAELYAANIENMIGTVKVPVGVIGPLRINGLNANGDFFVPLATTEAALVASHARGAEIVSRAGGASAAMLSEGVMRSPGFKFASLMESGLFIDWVTRTYVELKVAADATTRHGQLISIEPIMDNDIVFLSCRYTTGDASGQNMVTIATDSLCRYIEAHCPIRPLHWFIEANCSGDKKGTYLGLITGRGRKVTASVTVPREIVERYLHVDVERILECARMSSLGALVSGQIGAQAHFANGLAALYIATGQDAACVAEFFRRLYPDGGAGRRPVRLGHVAECAGGYRWRGYASSQSIRCAPPDGPPRRRKGCCTRGSRGSGLPVR